MAHHTTPRMCTHTHVHTCTVCAHACSPIMLQPGANQSTSLAEPTRLSLLKIPIINRQRQRRWTCVSFYAEDLLSPSNGLRVVSSTCTPFLTVALWCMHCFYPCFTNEETEAPSSYVICQYHPAGQIRSGIQGLLASGGQERDDEAPFSAASCSAFLGSHEI